MIKFFMAMGSVQAFLAVALGAFGAHALKNKLSTQMIEIYQTAVQYQMFHAIGLLAIALIAERYGPHPLYTISMWSILIGIVVFSGSLYTLSITGIKVLGAITPIGGVGFLLGWVLLVIALTK
jgi:uncharacterized membrane protein YgdD (TMEM256/DUF423 family)